MITSTSNAQVKNVIQLRTKAKARREQGVFVVEGLKMFEEAPAFLMEQVYVSESFLKQHGELESLAQYGYEVVADKVFKTMSDTQTPQGILCILRQENYTLEDILQPPKEDAPVSLTQVFQMAEVSGSHVEHIKTKQKDAGKKASDISNNNDKSYAPLIIILEDLQDPGNLGTIFRTAEGAGVSGIILSRNSVDIYNPKTIRSTMGSIYRMPFIYVEDLSEIMDKLKNHGIRTYGAHLKGINTYDHESYEGGSAFVIGNEGNGLTDELSEQIQCLIKIPMQGKLESLNAAMACGILVYEAARQRREKQ
ncbi:MAG: RNA methyltransferase [Lachnospiraceae bacterium]|nr:RNA methyltransferase [Lachnospiraceae bacterium]